VIQKDAVSDRKSGGETAGAGDEQSDGDFVPSSEVGKGAVGGNVICGIAQHMQKRNTISDFLRFVLLYRLQP
jgi:hypothetical protein